VKSNDADCCFLVQALEGVTNRNGYIFFLWHLFALVKGQMMGFPFCVVINNKINKFNWT